jgi:hypothetical protein
MENPSRNRSGKGRKWGPGRWLLALVLVLGLAFVCGRVLVRDVIGPRIVREAVSRAMARRWPGRIEVGRPTFRYNGVMDVDTIRLYDPNGQEAIAFSKLTATLGRWPGIKPKLQNVAISKMQVHVVDGHELDGFFKPKKKPKQGRPSKSILEAVKIHNLVIRDGGGPESAVVWENVFLTIGFEGNTLTFSAQNGKTGEGMLAVTGEVLRPSLDFEMAIKFSRQVTPEVRRVVASLLRFRSPWGGQGYATADLKLSGNLKETRSIETVGDVRTRGWKLVRDQLVILENLNATGQVKNRRLEFEELSGEFCSGDIKGDFYLDVQDVGVLVWGGDLTSENLNIDEFLKLLGHATGKSRGTGHLHMDFEIGGGKVETLNGTGDLLLSDADFGHMPVIKQMFQMLGMAKVEPLKMSDAAASFDVKQGLLEIERGYISNRLSAIEMTRGGTINLATRDMDFHVVGVMLKFINDVLRKIPLVRRFVSLKDKIVRLHVRGNMSHPILSKEPIRDVSEEFTEVFSDISKHGGKLGDGILKLVTSPFQSKKTPSK